MEAWPSGSYWDSILNTHIRYRSFYNFRKNYYFLQIGNTVPSSKKSNFAFKNTEQVPFFDLSCLKSRTIQIILVSTGVIALGVNTPIYYIFGEVNCELSNNTENSFVKPNK